MTKRELVIAIYKSPHRFAINRRRDILKVYAKRCIDEPKQADRLDIAIRWHTLYLNNYLSTL